MIACWTSTGRSTVDEVYCFVPSQNCDAFQIVQNGSLSEFFENFGGQLEDASFSDGFSVEAAVPLPATSAAALGHMAAVQQPSGIMGYQRIPAASQSNHIVAVNIPSAQSTGSAAASQQMMYYNGIG